MFDIYEPLSQTQHEQRSGYDLKAVINQWNTRFQNPVTFVVKRKA